jgi:anti-anti-sigma factor
MHNQKGFATTTLRLRPTEALDAEGVRSIRPELESIVTEPSRSVELDLSLVSFIDGSGVGAIAFLTKRLAARGGRLTVTGVSGQPRDLLQQLGLNRQLGIKQIPARRPHANDSALAALPAAA